MKTMLRILFYLPCVGAMLLLNAHAYIDPSATTAIVQAVAGVVVVVGTVVGVFWRRAKKKVQKMVGLDENANKEVEAQVQVQEDDDED